LGTGIRDVRVATADNGDMEELYHGSRVRSKLLDPARPIAARHHARQRAIALLFSRSPGIGSPNKTLRYTWSLDVERYLKLAESLPVSRRDP
jgi:hypothetical protein